MESKYGDLFGVFSSGRAGQPSFRNFPTEKPEHEKLPKQLTALIGQSTVIRKRHKDISTIQEVYTLRKDSQMILLSQCRSKGNISGGGGGYASAGGASR